MLSSKKICDIFLIYRKIFKNLNEEINIALKPYKITVQHAVYLMALKAKGALTIKDLNVFIDNDKAITTRVIKTLKKHEYVEKIGSKIKKYKISITSEGEKACHIFPPLEKDWQMTHDPSGMARPWRNPSIWGERTSPPMTVFR